MLRIFVDSGSSIKQDERERYGVEILPPAHYPWR